MTRVELLQLRSPAAVTSRGQNLSARLGESIVAHVTEVSPDGYVILNAGGRYITAITEIPLAKGMTLELLIARQDPLHGVRLKLTGVLDQTNAEDSPLSRDTAAVRTLIRDMMRSLSGESRDELPRLIPALLKGLTTVRNPLPDDLLGDVRNVLRSVLKSSGDGVSARLVRLCASLGEEMHVRGIAAESMRYGAPPIEDLTGSAVREALVDSGTVLEAKLHRAALSARYDEPGKAPWIGQDVKAQLLRLRDSFTEVRGTAFPSGRDTVALLAEQTIRDIEVFQVLSKATGAWCTFLPLVWRDLKEGEISLRAGPSENGERVFTCRIDLDLSDAGRISVSLVMRGSDLFVTFVGGSPEFRRLVTDHRDDLERTLEDRGVTLKAMNLVEEHEEANNGWATTESTERLLSVKV